MSASTTAKRRKSSITSEILAAPEFDKPVTRDDYIASIKKRYGKPPKADNEFTVREWMKITGDGKETARSFLMGLIEEGKWQRRKVGNEYFYSEVVESGTN